ncbi:MAG: hypothetical protein ABI273_03605 [Lacunisphaera sp.]
MNPATTTTCRAEALREGGLVAPKPCAKADAFYPDRIDVICG